MSSIVWAESYNTGIKSIDEQHMKLVDYLNELDSAISARKGKGILDKTLKNLHEYMDFHFRTEEKYFQQVNYPDTESHMIDHINFMRKVQSFVESVENSNADISIDIMSFLVDWLINHICGTDRKYSKFLIEHGIV